MVQYIKATCTNLKCWNIGSLKLTDIYYWWFRNPVNSPVEVGSEYPMNIPLFTSFWYIPGQVSRISGPSTVAHWKIGRAPKAWKSNHHLLIGLLTNHYLFSVGAYHLPKGTTISLMVVDFQGKGKACLPNINFQGVNCQFQGKLCSNRKVEAIYFSALNIVQGSINKKNRYTFKRIANHSLTLPARSLLLNQNVWNLAGEKNVKLIQAIAVKKTDSERKLPGFLKMAWDWS